MTTAQPHAGSYSTFWETYKYLLREYLREHGVDDNKAEKAGQFLLTAIALSALEFCGGWYLFTVVLSRAMVGCISYLALSHILPPNVALGEAQRLAVWDLL